LNSETAADPTQSQWFTNSLSIPTKHFCFQLFGLHSVGAEQVCYILSW